jgi:hypothetical protein
VSEAPAAPDPDGPIHEGGCFCGAIRFAVDAPYSHAVHCHCRTCQRLSGAPFVTWVCMPREAFRITAGEPLIRRTSPQAVRGFCGACGSALFMDYDGWPTLDVSIGSLDAPDAIDVLDNIWAAGRLKVSKGFDATLADHSGDPER